jgi:hypothetical protein
MFGTEMEPEEHDFDGSEVFDFLGLGHSERRREREIETDRQRGLEKKAAHLMIELKADQLDHQLFQYKKLRHEEERLRELVYFLERQIALAGHIQTPASIALQLRAEKAKLAEVQHELKELVAELQTILNIPFEERTKIDADRLAELIDEVKAKREQESIYRKNIYFLEEMQAKQGLAVRIDLFNELNLTRAKQDALISELQRLERRLLDEWHLELETVFELVSMNEYEFRKYVLAVARKKNDEEMQALRFRGDGEKSFDKPKWHYDNNTELKPKSQYNASQSPQTQRKTQSGST